MVYFHNDYSEGCHPEVLEALSRTNLEQTPGYGTDDYCKKAANAIRALCGDETLDVHFLVGGTQTNLTVIASALRPYQAVIAPMSAHIHVHETGAIEATGHKIYALPAVDGKISAVQVREFVAAHMADPDREHTAQPKMVYISNPTELGTIYRKHELEELADACRENGLYLFLDGARLGYGLTAAENDVTMEDLPKLCDVFYIGGTKVGALFGEALVISHGDLKADFRYMIKRQGGMLAKGRLLGVQFLTLLQDGLYFRIAKQANIYADRIRAALDSLGVRYLVPGTTNQIFPILPNALLAELEKEYTFVRQEKCGEDMTAVRFCTSWATTEENVAGLCSALEKLSK